MQLNRQSEWLRMRRQELQRKTGAWNGLLAGLPASVNGDPRAAEGALI